MDEQQYCLKWNNYHSTVNNIFQKLWANRTFVDVTLIVEGRKIECHKMVLSACSTYFEKLLTEHSAHAHPLIVLHDLSFSLVESLVTFMYRGEINVNHEHLDVFLKVAETLKVKGLADSPAIADFSRLRLLKPDFSNMQNLAAVPHFYPAQYLQESLFVPLANNTNAVNIPPRNSPPVSRNISPPAAFNALISHTKRSRTPASLTLPKKRARYEAFSSSLPPSPVNEPSSAVVEESPLNLESVKVKSPQQQLEQISNEIKTEAEEETDNELHIDLSVGQSPEESAVESDSFSGRNTPVPELDPKELRERHETAQSLAALAAQGTINFHSQNTQQQPVPPPPQLMLAPRTNPVKIKTERTGGKNGEKAYTNKDLEDGIEEVINGTLTPAKAIEKYKIPRRTFFRRLSCVRKQRGILSSKENASENNLKNHLNLSNLTGNGNISLVTAGVVQESNILSQSNSSEKVSNSNTDGLKKITNQALLSAGGVFSFLGNDFSPDYYLRCLKFNQAAAINLKHIKKEATVDGNSNISTSEGSDHTLSLVTQNGS